MTKKLEHNGLWESSRFMLPQHQEAALKQQKGWGKRERPTLDPQEQELILQEIGRGMQNMTEVTFTMFDSYDDRTITGVPVKFNQQLRTLKLSIGDEAEWVLFDDIVGVLSSE